MPFILRSPLRPSLIAAALFILTATIVPPSSAEDWPTYMREVSRKGWTPEQLSLPLATQWTVSAPEAPRKGMTGPQDRVMEKKILQHRITFDDAFHVAIVGNRLFFGSSVDHQLHCLNLETGNEIWSSFTNGPVRLAPTVHDNKVYFGSDDGCVYCLNADNGQLIWKVRAGPRNEKILGRQEMISRWPVRTGILIHKEEDGRAIAHFGAGIFPHENVYLYAVDAADGKVLWKVDNLSESDAGRNDLSPQGYFLANDDLLVIPSGRSLPAVLNRRTGEMIHKRKVAWRKDAGGVVGGTQALLSDGQIYTWGAHHILAMNQETGNVGFGWFAGQQMAVHGDAAYVADGNIVARLDRKKYAAWSRGYQKFHPELVNLKKFQPHAKGEDAASIKTRIAKLEQQIADLGDDGFIWKTPSPCQSRLVVAGNLLFAGGLDEIAAFDIETGKKVWTKPLNGEARGIAVANGHLVVSTTTGDIQCFAPGTKDSGRIAGTPTKTGENAPHPFPEDQLTPLYTRAAEEILKKTRVTDGFCLVLGSEEGRLAYELARRSNLEIYCIEPDPEKVARSRDRLAHTGLYGTRIVIHQADFSAIPYPNYFANLVVSDRLLLDGKLSAIGEPSEIARHIKPLGGVICLGQPAPAAQTAPTPKDLDSWLARTGLADTASIQKTASWTSLTRGPLPGAGAWSHQYGEPGNTATSNDERIKGGLSVLWYGDPGEGEMVNRHDGAVGPLAINGRLYVQGEDTILAYDAYNGRFLWEHSNPDAIRTGVFQNHAPGNLAANDYRLFFLERRQCLELDAASGQLKARHRLPEKLNTSDTHEWGYVSFHNGTLFGTATMRTELEDRLRRRGRVTEDNTDGIFAIDTETGKHLWDYRGGVIAHHTVAIGEDTIYFIDSSISSDERTAILQQDKARFKNLSPKEIQKEEKRLKEQDLRLAVAIDSKSGEVKWSTPVDVTDCSDIGTGGGNLTLIYKDGVILLCGANANGHYWKQFMGGEFGQRRLLALSAEDGSKLWSKDANYRHRPIVVNDEIIAEPWAFNLHSGEQKMRLNPVTGEPTPWSIMRSGHHCGMLAASPNMLLFRSGFTGFYDLNEDIGTRHFAGHRTGCWINAIPANGLVSIPEASAGCVCLFSISSTIVMEPRADREDWAIFSSVGANTPVKRMALNLGAPGDRRAPDGTPWLAYPRPRPEKVTSLDLPLDLQHQFASNGGFQTVNSEAHPTGDNAAPGWIYTSWADGLQKCSFPLLGPNDPPATYSLRLHFAHPSSPSAGKTPPIPPFKVRAQGKTVARKVKIPASNDSPLTPLVHEAHNIPVTDHLNLELIPSPEAPPSAPPPRLNAIEIIRED